MHPQPSRSLWRHQDFLKFWTGESISHVGNQVTILALPLTAVLTLNASAAEMGFYGTLRFLPYLLLTPFAGVWLDQRRRRPVMIVANLARAILLGVIPVAALLGVLHMQLLYVVGFLLGTFSVLFDLAYQSFLPSLVARDQLVEGNSKLQTSASVAEVGGPGLAGVLIGWLTAPLALLLDAASFLVSALTLAWIRKPEPAPAPTGADGTLPERIRDGFRLLFGSPYLRAVALEAATYNLFSVAISTLYALYAVRELGMGPTMLGLVTALGAVGSLVGAMLADPVQRTLGAGRALVITMLLACWAPLLLVATHFAAPAVLLAAYGAVSGLGLASSSVYALSLRQAAIPPHLLGRFNGSYRFLASGTTPLGALLGGYLGARLGLYPALVIVSAGLMAAVFWVILSPVWRLRHLEDAATSRSDGPALAPAASN